MYLLIKGKKPQPEGLDGLRNLPSNTLYTETLSANSMVPVNKQQGNSQFGMLPKDVMSRTDLTPADKLLLTVLNMESYSSGRVLLSHAALSRSSGVGRTGVLACLKSLTRAGLIEKDGLPVKQVQPYKLLHPSMRARGGSLAFNEVPGGSSDGQSRAVPAACPQCHRICKRLPRAGVCRSCHRERKIEQTVRRVLREEFPAAA
jgi:hypothetical protein